MRPRRGYSHQFSRTYRGFIAADPQTVRATTRIRTWFVHDIQDLIERDNTPVLKCPILRSVDNMYSMSPVFLSFNLAD